MVERARRQPVGVVTEAVRMRTRIQFLDCTIILDECTTLWGEPERVYVQNVEQLHVSSECN